MPELKVNTDLQGLGIRNPNSDNVGALIVLTSVDPSTSSAYKYEFGKVYNVFDIESVRALGIDEEYDSTGSDLVYHHFSEFFRINPTGELYFMFLASSVTMTQILAPNPVSAADLDKSLYKMIQAAEGRITMAGIVFNAGLTQGQTPDFTTITNAIQPAQTLADNFATDNHPFRIILPGWGFSYTLGTEPAAINSGSNGRVLVFIGKNTDKISEDAEHSDIGLFLGAILKNPVQQAPSYVEVNNLLGGELNAVQIDTTPISSLSTQQIKQLKDKGYNLYIKYPTINGIYLSDVVSCTATDDDKYITFGRVLDKLSRLVYSTLIPKLGVNVSHDADGVLLPSYRSQFQSYARRVLISMVNNGEITSGEVNVKPQLTENNTKLDIVYRVVPVGSARTINATIGLQVNS